MSLARSRGRRRREGRTNERPRAGEGAARGVKLVALAASYVTGAPYTVVPRRLPNRELLLAGGTSPARRGAADEC